MPPTDAERERLRLRGDVVVLDETRPRQLWKMAVADGTETRVTSGSDYVYAYKIADSGDRIIVSRRPTTAAGRLRQDGVVEHCSRRLRSRSS